MSYQLKRQVYDALSDVVGVPVERIRDSDGLLDDLGFDSLDLVELVMALEESFDFEIDLESNDASRWLTVKDVIDYVADRYEP